MIIIIVLTHMGFYLAKLTMGYFIHLKQLNSIIYWCLSGDIEKCLDSLNWPAELLQA